MMENNNSDVIQLYKSFPFATDEEYQQGLSGIMSSGVLEGKSAEEYALILRSSRVFYFNRVKGHSLTVEEALHSEEAATFDPSSTPPDQDEPRVLTFSELKDLIEQGKTDNIPNNRFISPNLNENDPSESTAPIRAKPWESVPEAVS